MESTWLVLIPFQDLRCWAGSRGLSIGRGPGGVEVSRSLAVSTWGMDL